jgi:hypothetical protein
VTVDRDVFQFIREHVRSVWALELLLRLKHDPERCWSVDELVATCEPATAWWPTT